MRSFVPMFLPLFCVIDLETSNGFMRATDELMMLNRLLMVPGVKGCNAEHLGQFVLARPEAQRVYGAARESHNKRTKNTLKRSICSLKWWQTLKGSIFGVKPSIHALMNPRGGLVVHTAEKPHSWLSV